MQVQCPECGGRKMIEQNAPGDAMEHNLLQLPATETVNCPTCQGKGEIPAPAPAWYQSNPPAYWPET